MNGLGGGLVAYQEGDGTFGDWTGTKDYKIYGTALESGLYNMTLTVTDSVGSSDGSDCVLNVNAPPFLTNPGGQVSDGGQVRTGGQVSIPLCGGRVVCGG